MIALALIKVRLLALALIKVRLFALVLPPCSSSPRQKWTEYTPLVFCCSGNRSLDASPHLYLDQIQVPAELPAILKAYTKEVIRYNPEDIVVFSRDYFASLANNGMALCNLVTALSSLRMSFCFVCLSLMLETEIQQYLGEWEKKKEQEAKLPKAPGQ